MSSEGDVLYFAVRKALKEAGELARATTTSATGPDPAVLRSYVDRYNVLVREAAKLLGYDRNADAPDRVCGDTTGASGLPEQIAAGANVSLTEIVDRLERLAGFLERNGGGV